MLTWFRQTPYVNAPLVSFLTELTGSPTMASKKKSDKFEFKGFINLEFSADERSEILSSAADFGETGFEAAVILVESGYKIGFSYDDYHGVVQGTLTCRDPGSKYYGYCFTLRHVEIGRIVQVFRYFYDNQLKSELYAMKEQNKAFDW